KTLPRVWQDDASVITPSWIGRAPKFAGTAATGTLKADEWRNFFTISLVFSLPKQWHDASDRYQALLENFMHLVACIEYASLRTINEKTIAAYEAHTLAYLRGHLDLFRDKVLSIYQHSSLHLPDFMRRFGPVHAWRAFPFERYNGVMHSINTNHKIGAIFACAHNALSLIS
ncbi:hypothetical protein SISNIDRAFT_419759, partial [Sistotremastrum niveocremeum HHB9708]